MNGKDVVKKRLILRDLNSGSALQVKMTTLQKL